MCLQCSVCLEHVSFMKQQCQSSAPFIRCCIFKAGQRRRANTQTHTCTRSTSNKLCADERLKQRIWRGAPGRFIKLCERHFHTTTTTTTSTPDPVYSSEMISLIVTGLVLSGLWWYKTLQTLKIWVYRAVMRRALIMMLPCNTESHLMRSCIWYLFYNQSWMESQK